MSGEFSLSLWGKNGAKTPYMVGNCSFIRIKLQILMVVIDQIKFNQLDDKVVDCAFNEYPIER